MVQPELWLFSHSLICGPMIPHRAGSFPQTWGTRVLTKDSSVDIICPQLAKMQYPVVIKQNRNEQSEPKTASEQRLACKGSGLGLLQASPSPLVLVHLIGKP